MLYNSDSSRLPQSIVSKINDFHKDDAEMRCEIILRHRDCKKLRALYEEIIKASDDDPDSFIASEVTKDFMARLRIGIMVDQAPVPDPKDGPPADMVFLQDVIARHAEIGWYKENAKPISENNFIPARWSRRRPSATDDMKSVVYLCCPVQNSIGWTFISALTTFFKGDWDGNKESRLLPARQLDFNDNETATIFKEIHHLGNWVINYDELLDRRQLINQNVNVIRYKQFATQGRNMIISSKAPLGLLKSMILSRIKNLSLEIPENTHTTLAEKFLNDAIGISGDIVLRAAKRGRSASELMGVVLSQYLIKHELGAKKYLGWYFIFISGPTDSPDCSELVKAADLEDSFQEVFSRQDLRSLIISYFNNTDPMHVRRKNSDQNIWKQPNYQALSDQVNVLSEIEKTKEVIPEKEPDVIELEDKKIEMDRRYNILKQNRVSNIYDLNKKEGATEHLPFLWVIHDEFAEWMMTDDYSKVVSNIVARLGVKARAAGIFLIFAAQRPDNRVMPMQLRANLGNRLILRVDAEGTSDIATGEKGAGAEKLLGKGHLAAKLEGEEKIITAQVPFIKTEEIESIVRGLLNQKRRS